MIEGQSAQEARNAQQGSLPPHNERHYYWVNYDDGTDGYFQLQTLQATFYHTDPNGNDCSWATCENLSPGTTLRHTVHYVFGSLGDVEYALQVLYNDQVDKLDPDVFNWQEYITMNPDVPSGGFADEPGAENHWMLWGINEGREGSYKFWPPAYLQANPDVAAYCQQTSPEPNKCAIDHYVMYGRKEGRRLWP